MKPVNLINKRVGNDNPCYFIAEIGSMFKTFDEAKNLIDSAIKINVDAIKFQTFRADTITTKQNQFDLSVTGHVSQYEFFKSLELSKELQQQIVNYANDKGITIFSAPSHIDDLNIMKQLDLPIYKIGGDLACHIPLLKEVAKLDKPIILSTGMCTLDEVRDSVDTIISTGNDQLILLHCVSDYPAKSSEANLCAIQTMKNEFDLPVGFSDHTPGILTSLTASIMGANVIERHFKDERNPSYPDDMHALSPNDFSNLISSIREAELSKGNGIKIPSISEQHNLLSNRVSIVALKDIHKDEIITSDAIDIRRPGTGLSPKYFDQIIGQKAKINIISGSPIVWDVLL
jgi:N,N'-diacetyllegionaminate synthase